MKILVWLGLTAFLGGAVYVYSKKPRWVVVVVLLMLIMGGMGMYRAETAPDTWCTIPHQTTLISEASNQGDYDFEIGNCQMAIVEYTKALALNPQNPQILNNRAYTYMRLHNYLAALTDLNAALALRPNYINALMNRGDIYNYYGPVINRQLAISDYEKVISLGGSRNTSVCGHLLLARHSGWHLGTLLDLVTHGINSCSVKKL